MNYIEYLKILYNNYSKNILETPDLIYYSIIYYKKNIKNNLFTQYEMQESWRNDEKSIH